MNPDQQPPPPPPPQPSQPPRSSFSCDRHPEEAFTGFCPSCLCERLTTLDQSAAGGASSSSRRNSTSSATAAIKALFKPVMMTSSKHGQVNTNGNSYLPELRRTKSFSASKHDAFCVAAYEPQRKSCDVRGGRHTLWSLFSNENNNLNNMNNNNINKSVVLETNVEESDVEVEVEVQARVSGDRVSSRDADLEDSIVVEVEERENVIEDDVIEEEDDVIQDVNVKPMKDYLDLEGCGDGGNNKKKMTSSRSNFWSAASVLSKKWQKWRRKQKKGEGEGEKSISKLPVEKPISRQYRETQSEIADYGYGRRSCDTDPRFSLDAGRVSFDDPRYSFDEPRASWDGYLIGRTFPRLPPMVEDMPHAPLHVPVNVPVVPRCDMQIPVEELVRVSDVDVPGGSIQTREYYLDSSSSKRRKSLDRSNSIRKMAAAVVAELDESKVMPVGGSNSKVSPTNEPPRVSNSNSLRDDCSETFELGFRDNGVGVGFSNNGVGNGFRSSLGGEKKEMKKPRRWKWKLWGFIHRRGKDDDEDRCSSVSGVGRSYSESWQDGTNGINGGMNRNVFRSNSSVSMRSSSLRKTNGHMNGKVIGNEQAFERNRSARYSPNHIDNGLLRFYLAPLSGSRRGGIGLTTGKSRGSSNNSHSIARSMLRLY